MIRVVWGPAGGSGSQQRSEPRAGLPLHIPSPGHSVSGVLRGLVPLLKHLAQLSQDEDGAELAKWGPAASTQLGLAFASKESWTLEDLLPLTRL